MGKRGNENSQLSKEEYAMAQSSGSGEPKGGPFARASNEELSRRRIVKTPSKWKQAKAAAAAAAAASPPTNRPSTAGPKPKNAFANFSFGTPATTSASTTTSTGSGGGMSLFGSSKPATTTTTTTPTMDSSSSSSSTTQPTKKRATGGGTTPTFSFGTSNNTTTTSTTTRQGKDTASSSSSFLTKIVKENIKHKFSRRSDFKVPLTQFVHSYLALHKNQQSSNSTTDKTITFDSKTNGGTSKPLFGGTTSSAKPFISTPAPNTNSLFGTSTTTPKATPVPFKFGTTPTAAATTTTPGGGGGFSFGTSNPKTPTNTTTSPSATTTPATAGGFSFSFGNTPKPPSTTPSDPSSTTNGGGGGGGETAEGGTTTTTADPPLESADTDWDLVLAAKIKAYHHRDDKGPKQFGIGELKLQQHKTNKSSRRMVMRNTSGKVLINLGISSSMKFEKLTNQSKTRGKKPVCRIVFFGLMDESRGSEMFTFVCRVEDLDTLHSKLSELASS